MPPVSLWRRCSATKKCMSAAEPPAGFWSFLRCCTKTPVLAATLGLPCADSPPSWPWKTGSCTVAPVCLLSSTAAHAGRLSGLFDAAIAEALSLPAEVTQSLQSSLILL